MSSASQVVRSIHCVLEQQRQINVNMVSSMQNDSLQVKIHPVSVNTVKTRPAGMCLIGFILGFCCIVCKPYSHVELAQQYNKM